MCGISNELVRMDGLAVKRLIFFIEIELCTIIDITGSKEELS